MTINNWSELLPYLPTENSLNYIKKWLSKSDVKIQIKKARNSKLGDYRYFPRTKEEVISINDNLDPELFFFTLTHEIAHLLAYQFSSRRKIKPHGKEWKQVFGVLLEDSISEYTELVRADIQRFAKNPKSGYYGDGRLLKYFQKEMEIGQVYLENLVEGMCFSIEKKTYKLLKKNRTRYICENMENKRKYLVHKLASVQKISNEKIQ